MGGNRKHGFMRGSRAGRNGVGQQQKFYCDACEREHGTSVERTGLTNLSGAKVLLCDRQYFKFKENEFDTKRNKTEAIAKLCKLKKSIGLEGDKGLKARINFCALVFRLQMKATLNNYELFDEHNIGERDFDTCFEMYDGDSVVHGLIRAAMKDYWLKQCIIKSISLECFESWVNTYEQIEQKQAA